MLKISSEDSMNVRLPPGDDVNSLVHVFIHVRDTYDCITEYNLPRPVTVQLDGDLVVQLMQAAKSAIEELNGTYALHSKCSWTDKWTQQLNQATFLSALRMMNEMNEELLQGAINSKMKSIVRHNTINLISVNIDLASILVSPLKDSLGDHV